MRSFTDDYADLLTEPESMIPVLGIRIIAYYDREGQLQYKVKHDVATENIPVSQVIGIMELAKADLTFGAILEAHEGDEYDPDDWTEGTETGGC
jgi:hypothetical protein